MDLYEAIEKRRTTRQFKGPAGEDQIKRIIDAGTKAPSPGNNQCWEFVVVDDPELKDKIGEMKYVLSRGNKQREEPVSPEKEEDASGQKSCITNSSLILIYYDTGTMGKLGTRTNAAAAWSCIENMLLAATAEGMASKITSYWGEMPDAIARLVNAPENMELAAAISVGVAAEEPSPRKLRPEGSWLHQNRF